MNHIAVWILSLVTPPDRAVTTVGDFAEESRERGRVWFWLQIARTFGAHLLREFAGAPSLILWCFPLGYVVLWACAIPAHLILQTFLWDDIRVAYTALVYNAPWRPVNVLSQQIFSPSLGLLLIETFVVGRVLARVTRRPLSAVIAFHAGAFIYAWIARQATLQSAPAEPNSISVLWIFAAMLMGAIWQRRASLTATLRTPVQLTPCNLSGFLSSLPLGALIYVGVICLLHVPETFELRVLHDNPLAPILMVVFIVLAYGAPVATGAVLARMTHRPFLVALLFLAVWVIYWSWSGTPIQKVSHKVYLQAGYFLTPALVLSGAMQVPVLAGTVWQRLSELKRA